MGSRQEQFSGSGAVRRGHELDPGRLEAYLRGRIDGFKGPLTVKQFRGGQSNPTYLLQSPSGSYVMRRKPPGQLLKSAHAVDREFQVLSALHGTGFPVPRPLVLCEDEAVAGTMFYLMEYVQGRVFWDLDLPGLTPAERRAIYDHVNRIIADLHNLDYQKIGLAEYGKPGNYFARQISRWSKQYTASETQKIRAMDELMAWLPGNIPDDDSSSIVHGDYRLDNMILHPTEPRVIAVLDWELSTIGHPLGDFTYHLMAWQMPDLGIGSAGLLNADLEALGIPSEEEYVGAYCRRTGRDHLPDKDYLIVFCLFRLAAILHGIKGRLARGNASSAHAAQMVERLEPLAELAWAEAEKAEL